MTDVFRFSTDQCAPHVRIPCWSDQVWQRIGGIQTTTFDGEPLRAELLAGTLGPVQVCHLDIGRHRIRRTPQQVRGEGAQWLKIVFQLKGRLFIEQRDCRVVLRDRIAAYVERHLHDPELSIDMIARSLKCTKRYLHRVCNDGERTLNAFIRDRRLARCGQDLIKSAFAGQSITQISYACGFRNSAHFSRVFREKFGMTPRAYRKRHPLQAGTARP